jgi:hypothetical protein
MELVIKYCKEIKEVLIKIVCVLTDEKFISNQNLQKYIYDLFFYQMLTSINKMKNMSVVAHDN